MPVNGPFTATCSSEVQLRSIMRPDCPVVRSSAAMQRNLSLHSRQARPADFAQAQRFAARTGPQASLSVRHGSLSAQHVASSRILPYGGRGRARASRPRP